MNLKEQFKKDSNNFNHLEKEQMKNQSQFSITITRTGVAAGVVEIPVFGYLEAQSQYTNVLSTTPTSVEMGLFGGNAIADANKAIFTFGADVIVIESDAAISYPSFVAATAFDRFNVAKFNYQISDTTNGLTQLNKQLKWRERTIYGKDTSNNIALTANKSAFQFQSGQIDVDAQFRVNKNVCLTQSIIAVAQTITINFTIESTERIS